MTAFDKLRRLLDERGVEHEGGERSVRWRDHNGVMMQAFPLANGELGMEVWSCTPEQAIAATLGPQIVRCKDCKHFTHNKEFWLEPHKVPFPMIGATSDCCDFWADTECKVEPDGFCAWGVRREDA